MMTKQELTNLCLELEDTCEEYPFYPDCPVIKHKANKKMFALIFEMDGLSINLKLKPFDVEFFKEQHKSILPAYHMNKTHWVMVKPNGGDVSKELLTALIKSSYDLTKG
ncbi:MAG: MmcQ/YjbR family DNA-binding protein [Firmicutes bacterium]|nr:MmcQ/YjbR family DNA-binding protein [Bacillota bacterium]